MPLKKPPQVSSLVWGKIEECLVVNPKERKSVGALLDYRFPSKDGKGLLLLFISIMFN
jgi:hypothetical protein